MPNFRRWVEFRIRTLTDFMREIRDTARSVRPEIKVIPEIYPGIEEEAVRVGADVYQMYAVVDAVAHEYEFGEGEHMASSRTQLEWLLYQTGMLSFRAFAEGKATWILNYSWDGDKGVDPREAMKNLAMSEIAAGANFWDAAGHEMANSNDLATRAEIFAWIKRYEEHIYGVRDAIHPVGVYFSPTSRDFAVQDFLPSYRGIVLLMLRSHREVQIVTPRTLGIFRGNVLVLPNVSSLDDAEKSALSKYQASGGRIVVTGMDSLSALAQGRVVRFPSCPGKEFLSDLQKDVHADLNENARSLLATLSTPDSTPADVIVDAPSLVVAHIAAVRGKIHLYFVNFEGLVPHAVATPIPQLNVRITAPADAGDILHFVPFLGPESLITGRQDGKSRTFQIPKLERGAIAWLEPAK